MSGIVENLGERCNFITVLIIAKSRQRQGGEVVCLPGELAQLRSFSDDIIEQYHVPELPGKVIFFYFFQGLPVTLRAAGSNGLIYLSQAQQLDCRRRLSLFSLLFLIVLLFCNLLYFMVFIVYIIYSDYIFSLK